MQPEGRDEALLWDMLNYAREAQRQAKGLTLDTFVADMTARLACERALEIVGEAANHVSEPLRAAHPEVVWSDIIGLRNVLIHGYSEVDHEIIWTVLDEHVPVLIRQLEALLAQRPPAEGTEERR